MISDTLVPECVRLRDRLVVQAIEVSPGRYLAATLLTAADAAEILNTLPSGDDPADSYTMVNVINEDNTVRIHLGRYQAVPGREDHPLTGVNWYGARLLARQTGACLPTVEEWQAVAAAHRSRYPWGDEPPSARVANVDEYVGSTSPVTASPPSALGFYDLLGNVGEWCDAALGRDEAPVVGGGWNKSIGPEWWQPRFKWRRVGTVGIGVRLLFTDSEDAR